MCYSISWEWGLQFLVLGNMDMLDSGKEQVIAVPNRDVATRDSGDKVI